MLATIPRPRRPDAPVWPAIFLALACASCAHRIDWKSRLGTYTYDQAVLELGPPDRSANLTDGRLVCEWRAMRGVKTLTFYGGTGYVGGPYRPWGGLYAGAGPVFASEYVNPDQVLRLTFGTDKLLENWQLVYK